MDVSWKALQYLHAWEHQLPVEEGIACEHELRQHCLDYSVDSLGRIDVFLDDLRETRGDLLDGGRWGPQIHTLLRLLAFYVGEVVARSSQRAPIWLTFEQFIERYGGDPADACIEHSLVLIDGNIVFMPLVSIVARATEATGRKSVSSSARALIGPDLQSGPRAAEALAPWPAPTWAVETRARITAAPAAVMKAYELEEPHWASGDELNRLFTHAPELLRSGTVVWGALVQANICLILQVCQPMAVPPHVFFTTPSGALPARDWVKWQVKFSPSKASRPTTRRRRSWGNTLRTKCLAAWAWTSRNGCPFTRFSFLLLGSVPVGCTCVIWQCHTSRS